MTPYYSQDGTVLYHGDSRAVLPTLPAQSVDAMVTDPPAGIAFMGKDWDNPWEYGIGDVGATNPGAWSRVAVSSSRNPMCRTCHQQRRGRHKERGRGDEACHCDVPDFDDAARAIRARQHFIATMTAIFTECRRVLKPGAHAFVWALPRTSHWTATALEDAGFEIRDVVVHLYGQGFPKSLDVGKALDKVAGAERVVVGPNPCARPNHDGIRPWSPGMVGKEQSHPPLTAPATDLALQWDGWGTALKPASEHWLLCRAPLAAPTVAANVARWGTGALNVDASRLTATSGDYAHPGNALGQRDDETAWRFHKTQVPPHPAGRWPPNVALSHTLFCEPVGTREIRSGGGPTRYSALGLLNDDGWEPKATDSPRYHNHSWIETVEAWACAADCPVALLDAQSGERRSGRGVKSTQRQTTNGVYGHGLGLSDQQDIGGDTGGASRFFYVGKASAAERSRGLPEGERNTHPTVKPLALMRWLLTLVVPPGGVVLDPFAGSGSTLVAAAELGIEAIGIESEERYCEIAANRLRQGVLPPEVAV